MILSFPKYFIRRAVLNLKGAPLLNALTVVTISLTMLILSSFLLVFYNISSLLSGDRGQIEISVYLKDGLQKNEIEEIGKTIKGNPGVLDAKFVSKEEALNTFVSWNRKIGAVFEKIKENPLPASFELELSNEYIQPAKVKKLVTSIEKIKGVEDVDYSSQLFEKLSSFLRAIKAIGVFLLLFLSLATIFLVTSTIRLNIYSRRAEIGIMKIVGGIYLIIAVPLLERPTLGEHGVLKLDKLRWRL